MVNRLCDAVVLSSISSHTAINIIHVEQRSVLLGGTDIELLKPQIIRATWVLQYTPDYLTDWIVDMKSE